MSQKLPPQESPASAWPAGDGEMARRIRGHDWAATPLGPIGAWPLSLKLSINMIMQSPVAMVVLWGTEGIRLYNDAYIPIAGDRHPEGLGKPVLECWPEIAEFTENLLRTCMSGQSLTYHDQHLVLHRNNGNPEDAWMDLYYSPIPGETGVPEGILSIIIETSDRVGTQRAIQKNEQRWRTLTEAMPQLVWFTNGTDGWCEYLSSQWTEYSGVPAEELLGRAWLSLLHPDDQESTAQAWADAVAGRADYNIEYRIRRHDGEYRWFKVRGVPVRDESGAIANWYGTCTDIHEQKETEQALRTARAELEVRVQKRTAELESQKSFLKAILEHISDGIVACDKDGTLSLFNRATRTLHGLPDVPLPAEQWAEYYSIFHADGVTPMQMDEIPLYRALMEGHVKDAEMVVAPKNSPARSLLASGQALFDGKGEKIGAVVSMHDVTDRKRREEDLAKSRTFLRQIIDSVADPIFVKDRQHRWIEGNKALWNLIGQPEHVLLGKSDYDVFPKEQADKFWEGDERVFKGEIFMGEEVIRDGTGENRIISTKKVPFTLPNGEQGLVGVIRDITDERCIEEELRNHRDNLQELVEIQTQDLRAAKEAAEAANQSKTEFLANMSHEIRTPMNAVIGLSNILATSAPLTEQQQEFIQTLQMSADSLLSLINDLLDIAKIEAHSMELEKVPFNLSRLVQEATSMMAVQVEEKQLAFSSEAGCTEERLFLGDPTRLRQIILNLCGNAIKFTENGGVSVTVHCGACDIAGHEMISIAVKDTGIGIPLDKLETIFDKFVQADSSINRRYGGTGLGLAITKTLTEIMGGAISVESEVGKGSVFTVNIPLEIASDATVAQKEKEKEKPMSFPHEASGIQPQSGNSPRLLLVEDYAPNILVATMFLEQFGYTCDVAKNGIEAIEKVKAGDYFVVLMDVQMHGMNGLEATAHIRTWESETGRKPLTIIGMTAHALAGDRERCIAAGMSDYISKPFNPDQLQHKLEKVLAEKG